MGYIFRKNVKIVLDNGRKIYDFVSQVINEDDEDRVLLLKKNRLAIPFDRIAEIEILDD